MSTQLQITITEKAADKVREFLAAEDDAELSALPKIGSCASATNHTCATD